MHKLLCMYGVYSMLGKAGADEEELWLDLTFSSQTRQPAHELAKEMKLALHPWVYPIRSSIKSGSLSL